MTYNTSNHFMNHPLRPVFFFFQSSGETLPTFLAFFFLPQPTSFPPFCQIFFPIFFHVFSPFFLSFPSVSFLLIRQTYSNFAHLFFPPALNTLLPSFLLSSLSPSLASFLPFSLFFLQFSLLSSVSPCLIPFLPSFTSSSPPLFPMYLSPFLSTSLSPSFPPYSLPSP